MSIKWFVFYLYLAKMTLHCTELFMSIYIFNTAESPNIHIYLIYIIEYVCPSVHLNLFLYHQSY